MSTTDSDPLAALDSIVQMAEENWLTDEAVDRVERNRQILTAVIAERERLRDGLVRVMMHTGHHPGASNKLLEELLANIARIASAALTPANPEGK